MKTIYLLILIIAFVLYQQSCKRLETFTVKGKDSGPIVLLIGGTHGNEPAGTYAIHKLKKTLKIKRGTVIMVPEVNPCGVTIGARGHPSEYFGDINRMYPDKTEMNRRVFALAQQSDWVFDMHEGWGFHRLNKESMGSGIYPTTKESKQVANAMVDTLNKTITEPYKKFLIGEVPLVKGSLRYHLQNKNYILLETTGQNEIQPLSVRVKQCLICIDVLLKNLKML